MSLGSPYLSNYYFTLFYLICRNFRANLCSKQLFCIAFFKILSYKIFARINFRPPVTKPLNLGTNFRAISRKSRSCTKMREYLSARKFLRIRYYGPAKNGSHTIKRRFKFFFENYATVIEKLFLRNICVIWKYLKSRDVSQKHNFHKRNSQPSSSNKIENIKNLLNLSRQLLELSAPKKKLRNIR